MRKNNIQEMILDIFHHSEDNLVHLPEENVDIPILEEPLTGYASADDPLFEEYKNPEAIGESWLAPHEWLESAKTVIVFFFPYSEAVRNRAAASKELINEAWKYGYPAGADLSKKMTNILQKQLEEAGLTICNPIFDPRMKTTSFKVMSGNEEDRHYIPSWSTRHAAYAAGLGTFGIHRHLITEKGSCGSLTTLITDAEFEPDPRPYTELYEYCIHCGACALRCPADAITLKYLRNLKKCSDFGHYLTDNFGGGGCGKCLFGVPCEHTNPSKK